MCLSSLFYVHFLCLPTLQSWVRPSTSLHLPFTIWITDGYLIFLLDDIEEGLKANRTKRKGTLATWPADGGHTVLLGFAWSLKTRWRSNRSNSFSANPVVLVLRDDGGKQSQNIKRKRFESFD